MSRGTFHKKRDVRCSWISIPFCMGFFFGGCAQDAPQGTPLDSRVDHSHTPDMRAFDKGLPNEQGTDSGICPNEWPLPDVSGNNSRCQSLSTDYKPNASDDWPACISDDDTYHPFDANISSIARVSAFEEIMKRLMTGSAPTSQAFIDAKVAYTQAEGLDSRVSRREDEHYPKATKACADMDAQELQQHKDRCVGPAQIQPLLNQAFLEGTQGKDPIGNAARIEAALLWFLYVSIYKESVTCTTTKKDCDSSQAYYNGGEARSGSKGLGRYIRTLSTQAHDRAWDGILAVRCWRDLDSANPAVNLTLRDKALAQLDKALLRGLALLVKSRIKAIEQITCAKIRDPLWASVKILGGVLHREATARNATLAKTLHDELAKSAVVGVDFKTITTILEEMFPCP